MLIHTHNTQMRETSQLLFIFMHRVQQMCTRNCRQQNTVKLNDSCIWNNPFLSLADKLAHIHRIAAWVWGSKSLWQDFAPNNQTEKLLECYMSVNRTAAAITTSKVRNHRTFTSPSISLVERASLDLLGRQRREPQYKRCFLWQEKSYTQTTLKNQKLAGSLAAHTPSTYLGCQAKPREPSGQTQQVKISRHPTLPGAEAETTSRQKDQCTGMKKTAQAVTVNDFYFLKNEITVNILTGLQVALQYSWR